MKKGKFTSFTPLLGQAECSGFWWVRPFSWRSLPLHRDRKWVKIYDARLIPDFIAQRFPDFFLVVVKPAPTLPFYPLPTSCWYTLWPRLNPGLMRTSAIEINSLSIMPRLSRKKMSLSSFWISLPYFCCRTVPPHGLKIIYFDGFDWRVDSGASPTRFLGRSSHEMTASFAFFRNIAPRYWFANAALFPPERLTDCSLFSGDLGAGHKSRNRISCTSRCPNWKACWQAKCWPMASVCTPEVWDSMPPVTAYGQHFLDFMFGRATMPRHIITWLLIFFQAAFWRAAYQ